MRRRIANYTIHADTGIIVNEPLLRIEDIRLIVNETQKVVLCSSMKKDTILGVENLEGESVIWLESGFHVLKEGDQLTIEIDKGDNLSSVESKVEEESAAIQSKIDNIKLPEIDTTELAKQGENQEATNSKILEEIQSLAKRSAKYSRTTGNLTIENVNITIE